MRTPLVLIGVAALVAGVVTFGADRSRGSRAPRAPHAAGPALDEIREERLAGHVRFLSGDLLEGRAPGSRGGELAAAYHASQLALLGYEPAASRGSFFQPVPIVETTTDTSFVLSVNDGPASRHFSDVVAASDVQEPRVEISGEIVFVGYGSIAPDAPARGARMAHSKRVRNAGLIRQ